MKKLFLIPLMALCTCVMAFAVNITSRSELQSFLEADGTNSGVIAADLDLSNEGAQFVVAGTKDLTINEGVTLSLKSAFADKAVEAVYSDEEKLAGFCFRVPNGAKLTLKGNGSIAADRSVVLVEKGGEFIIGETTKASQLKITTTEGRIKNRVLVVLEGTAYLYNAYLKGRSGVIWNSGTIKIDGGTYHGQSSASDKEKNTPGFAGGDQYTYAFNSRGIAVLKNATFLGCHGSVSPEENGRMEIDNCTIKTDPANGAYSGASSYHGLYICTYGIATVRNSKLYSKSGRALWIGNNDKLHTFGLAYIYENVYFKGGSAATNYPYLQPKTYTDDEALFPVEIDKESDWYKIAATGSNNVHKFPLPVGYAYREIISSGEPTAEQVVDAEAYAEGYRVKVVSTIPAEQQEAASVDPSATIPWQQETTWTGDVPAATDVVTIPEGKVVVVKNDEATTDVKAAQVKIEGEGASLTVEDGTSLEIGQSLNITPGAKLVVEAGAMVTVGEGGVVAAEDAAIEVKTAEGKTGVFMIAPGVKENTHPMARVELKSKAYKRGENDYVWQRFGLPAYMTGVKRGDMIYDHTAYPTSVLKLDYANRTWAPMADEDEFIPFRCYELTTNVAEAGAVYTFQCNLMGNGNAELELVDDWNCYANSYTAPIDIAGLIESIGDNVSGTVYLYRASDNWWYDINNANLGEEGIPTVIDPMQAFIFQRRTLGGANPEVNYADHVWGPIMTPGAAAGAPARNRANISKAIVEITAADGTKDVVRLLEGSRFSADFDNTWDAAKYMNTESFNLYADANEGEMSILATDNLEGTTLSMTTKDQTSFTMTFRNVNDMNYAILDKLTGTKTMIAEGETYMFSVTENSNIEGRFEIVPVAKVATAIENIAETAALKGIYTVTGQFVGNDYHNLPNGIYVVDGKKIVK